MHDLLEWLVDVIRVHRWLCPDGDQGQRSGGCLIHDTGCLSSSDLVLESQGCPRVLPVFRLCCNPQEVGSNASQATTRRQDRWTCQSARGQAGKKQMLPSSLSFYVGCHPKAQPRFREGLLTSNDPINKILHWLVRLLGFYLVLDLIKLKSKISCHPQAQ